MTGAVPEHGAAGCTLLSPKAASGTPRPSAAGAREIVPAVREAVAKEGAAR